MTNKYRLFSLYFLLSVFPASYTRPWYVCLFCLFTVFFASLLCGESVPVLDESVPLRMPHTHHVKQLVKKR